MANHTSNPCHRCGCDLGEDYSRYFCPLCTAERDDEAQRADAEAEHARPDFATMTQPQLVELAVTLLAETIRKRFDIDALQCVAR